MEGKMKMKKKKVTRLLALLLAAATVFTACGTSSSNEDANFKTLKKVKLSFPIITVTANMI